jgi:arylsulfatase A-like enzyme
MPRHTRPRWLAPLLITMLCGAFAAQSMAGHPQPDSRKPNVLFFVIDDLNDWLGCLDGHPQAKTPNIDRLAKRGVLFTNAHCQAPLCNPSRTSFLTGKRPSTTGIYALQPWFRSVPRWRSLVTLPQYFAQHGYRTLTTGKVYHDGYPPAPDRSGGKEFSLFGFAGTFGPRPPTKFVSTPDNHPLVDWGVFPESDEEQDDWKVADWAIEQLRAPQDRPFFLSVGLRHPHVPCYTAKKWFDLYPEASLTLPRVEPDDRADTPRSSWYLHWKLPEPRLAWLERAHQWKPLVRAYLASISFVDSQVGRVLEALEASGKAENTVVVLISDHGWHLGEKAITGKNSLWEPSTRVPLIIAGRGREPIARGKRCMRPAELLDVYPTLAAVCGLPPRADLDGHSLAPLLKNPSARRPWPAITTHGPGNHTVRTEQWRYIRYADGAEELYDLRTDRRETHNLAGNARVKGKKGELAAWLPRNDAAPAPGSLSRLIEWRNGVPYWEGKPIGQDDPIPMDD